MQEIEDYKKTQLDLLQKKFGYRVAFVKSVSLFSILALALIYGVILLNDLAKVYEYVWDIMADSNNDNEKFFQNCKEESGINESAESDENPMHSEELVYRLERIHVKLMKAINSNKKMSQIVQIEHNSV